MWMFDGKDVATDLFRIPVNPRCKTELNTDFILSGVFGFCHCPRRHQISCCTSCRDTSWMRVGLPSAAPHVWLCVLNKQHAARWCEAVCEGLGLQNQRSNPPGPLTGRRCLHADRSGYISTSGAHMKWRWSAFTLFTAELRHLSSQNTLVCPRVWNANWSYGVSFC